MLIRIRDNEGCDTQSNFIWDSVWINAQFAIGGYADWILANPALDDPPEQRGGLRARMQLQTAILLCLFTDKRLPDGMAPLGDARDRRGWWGNGIQLDGEPAVEMGSLLWTLERSPLTNESRKKAIDYATEALATLIDQGAVARFVVDAEVNPIKGYLGVTVDAYDNLGGRLTNVAFDIVWQQLRTPAPMTYSVRS